MRLLLDTHAFLWWVADSAQLSLRARRAMADADNECLVSAASCWEMAIKVRIGKLKLPSTVERFVPHQMMVNGFRELAIDVRHAAAVARLPFHHRDPFDRLLVSQALIENLAIVSGDRNFGKYGLNRVW